MFSRIRAPFKKRQENSDIKYLQFTQVYYNGHYYEENGDDDHDDTSSISTVSTNETMDNIPGTGRIMDKFPYQFFGRKLERAIFRMSMTNMSPDRIFQYLRWEVSDLVCPVTPFPLGNIIHLFNGEQIAGLKSLVKQSQSDSLYRSAAALSALFRLTASWGYGDFYAAVVAVEPIFHLESLAKTLDDSHPEKNYFLFLIAISRAQLQFNDYDIAPEDTKEFAINCRQRLLDILSSRRFSSHGQVDAITNACLLLANICSSLFTLEIHCHSVAPAIHSVIETAYFLLIFLVHFLIDQYQTIHNIRPLQKLILTTFSRWFESVIASIIFSMECHWDLPQLQPICAFSILRLTISNMQLGVLSPRRIPRLKHQSLFSLDVFPRRIRNSTPQEDNPIILQSYLGGCTIRTRRLLASPDELRREARDSTQLKYGSPSDGLYYSLSEEKSKEELQRSLDRARSVPTVENDLTREFLEARQVIHRDPTCIWDWKEYMTRQRKRHGIGEYCRSNLDWDWDSSSCLKRLFRTDMPKRSSRSDVALQQGAMGIPATICRGSNKDISEVTIIEKAPNILEKAVRIRYETEAGEVRYKTFYAGPSVEDVVSGACADPRPQPSLAQETDIGSLIGASEEAGEVREAVSQDGITDSEVADEDHEEKRTYRELNPNNAEDENASVDTMDRPQYDSRIDEV